MTHPFPAGVKVFAKLRHAFNALKRTPYVPMFREGNGLPKGPVIKNPAFTRDTILFKNLFKS
jgi:hypothetical protein